MLSIKAEHGPVSREEELAGQNILRVALGMEHIKCEGCFRNATQGSLALFTEQYGYLDSQHNCYWQWLIAKARRIAQRDAIRVEPIPMDMLKDAILQARNAIKLNPDHVYHLPEAVINEPILVAMLPIQPFGASMIIDGNHRLIRRMELRKHPMMQVLNPIQSTEALTTPDEIEEGQEKITRILEGAVRRGINFDHVLGRIE